MHIDKISEIGIDHEERLYIRPENAEFPYIYREAMEVHWNSEAKFLYSPKPREWSYLSWLKQMLCATEQQSYKLIATPETIFTNIPNELKKEIHAWLSAKA